MTAKTAGLAASVLLLAMAAWATDSKDYLKSPGTDAVALTGGDTINTYSVSCGDSVATLLRPAVTDRSRRRICFENLSSVQVHIGSSTVIASDNFVLGESTSSAVSPIFCTDSSAAFYCGDSLGVAGAPVSIIEETQSLP